MKHRREIDLARLNEPHLQEKYKDPNLLGVNVSTDCPVYVRAHRLMEDGEKHDPEQLRWDSHLIGWTLELSCWTRDTKVFVRIGRKPEDIKVFIQEGDGKFQKLYEAEFEQVEEP